MIKRLLATLLCLIIMAGLMPAAAADTDFYIQLDSHGLPTTAMANGYSFETNDAQLVISADYTLLGFTYNGVVTHDLVCKANGVLNLGTIAGGAFTGEVMNTGTISGGVFTGEVMNTGAISGGWFAGYCESNKSITGGVFAQEPAGDVSFSGTVTPMNSLTAASQGETIAIINHTDAQLRALLNSNNTGVAGETYQVSADGGLADKALIGLYLNKTPVKDSNGKYYIESAFAPKFGNVYYEFTMPGSETTVQAVFHKPVTEIALLTTASVAKNTDLTLTSLVTPLTATYRGIVWSVADGGGTGAVITGDTFRAEAAGTATVRATIDCGKTPDEDFTKDFDIAVTDRETYLVTVVNGTGSGRYSEGDPVTITADAPDTDMQFKSWTVVPAVTFTQGGETTAEATFTMPASIVVATAAYEALPGTTYTVTVAANPSLGATVLGGGTYKIGSSATVLANPSTGYHFVRWIKDSSPEQVSTQASYTFSGTADTLMTALLESDSTATDTLTIAPTVGTPFTISYEPSDSIENIKQKIQTVKGYDPQYQTLSHLGTPLTAGNTAAYYNIVAGARLALTIPRSDTPTADVTSVAKTAAVQAGVPFTLTNDPALSGKWKVFANDTDIGVHGTVTASAAGSVLTLTDKDGDIKAGTYYVSFTGGGKAESTRLALTVTDYVRPNPFGDVAATDWFYDSVLYVYEQKLMFGTGATAFSPNVITTRGMIVALLYRLEGTPEVSGVCPFDDVNEDAYYKNAIIWAAGNGIVYGYDESTFGPENGITREQMAAFLYRYAAYKKYDMTPATDLSVFSDYESISPYAVASLSWANASGLILGKSDDILDPGGSAIRCQVAAILHRFCVNIAA